MSLNVEAITDFKIAIGAVERAACQHIRTLAAQVPADQAIVEIGAFKGRTTGFLALGSSEGNGARVTSVDPWDTRPVDSWPEDYFDKRVLDEYGNPETFAAYKAHLKECGVASKVTVRKGFAVDVAKTFRKKVGLLWHDAEHTADAVEADLTAWAPHVAPGGWVVLHDAGNAAFGVVEGAGRALDNADWDWAGRELLRWKKKPHLRGILAVRKK